MPAKVVGISESRSTFFTFVLLSYDQLVALDLVHRTPHVGILVPLFGSIEGSLFLRDLGFQCRGGCIVKVGVSSVFPRFGSLWPSFWFTRSLGLVH